MFIIKYILNYLKYIIVDKLQNFVVESFRENFEE